MQYFRQFLNILITQLFNFIKMDNLCKKFFISPLPIIVLYLTFAAGQHEKHFKFYDRPFDPCIEQCNFNRPADDHSPYKLICDDLKNEVDRVTCITDCRYCMTSICDSSKQPVHFNCPSYFEFFGRCKLRCDYQRPVDIPTQSFEFFCDNRTLFPTEWDVRQCSNDCELCSPIVCSDLDDIFRCPSIKEPLTIRPPAPPSEPSYDGSTCEWRCDHERPEDKNLTDSYVLSCRDTYPGTDSEIQACQKDCLKCPLEVCDFKFDPDTFYCPPSNRTVLKGQLEPLRGVSYILSWVVIASIAVAILGCIMGTAFYGKSKSGVCVSCEWGHCCHKSGHQVEPENNTLVED